MAAAKNSIVGTFQSLRRQKTLLSGHFSHYAAKNSIVGTFQSLCRQKLYCRDISVIMPSKNSIAGTFQSLCRHKLYSRDILVITPSKFLYMSRHFSHYAVKNSIYVGAFQSLRRQKLYIRRGISVITLVKHFSYCYSCCDCPPAKTEISEGSYRGASDSNGTLTSSPPQRHYAGLPHT